MDLHAEGAIALEALDRFIGQAARKQDPVIRQRPLGQLIEALDVAGLIERGGLGGETLNRFLGTYLDAATRLHHPGYMAHQVAVPHSMGAVAALVDGATNNAMAIYEMGPSAAAVEFAVVNWMLAQARWHPTPPPGTAESGTLYGGGVLTHGGSLANLTALAAARRRAAPAAWHDGVPGNLAVIAPQGCHYSVARSAALLGLGSRAVHPAPTDADGRLIPSLLPETIRALRRGGTEIMAVVANACSTAVGLYDHLRPVGEICREMGVWLHVDGAHGASALVSERHRSLLDGLELADSLIWDAHKMLRAPLLCAAVLVRDHRDLDAAFQEEASYLFHDKDQPGFDFIHRTVECTKAALGLKILFALAADGRAGIATHVDRLFSLAREAAAFLRAQPGITVAVEPQANIVCFRTEGDDHLQLELRKRLIAEGHYYLSATEFRGQRWLRLALMNPATELADIQALAERIRQHLAALGRPAVT